MNARACCAFIQPSINTMDIKKIKVGSRYNFRAARNKETVQRGTVEKINHTATGAFVVFALKDGGTVQTRPALVG